MLKTGPLRLLTLALTLLLMAPHAEAQLVRGFVSGTVTDATNSVVPGVQVTITSMATNISRETLTNNLGFYRFAAVEPGDYSVEFKLAGFETHKIPSITVRTAKEVVINRTLKLSAATTEISVMDTPGVELEKTIPTVERTFSEQIVDELPFQVYNGARDVTRLALLAPTVNRAPGSNEFAANGQRARNNNFTIDGVDNNDLSVTSSLTRMIPEAVQQVQVQTTAYAAEFGRTSGAQVSAVTKSGTNTLHGEGWEYYRGNWMEPLSLANKRAGLTETPRFVVNQFGGDVGGPIIKERTFFFGLLELNRRREAPTAANAISVNIPTPAGFAALSTVPLGTGQTAASRQAALEALSFLPGIHARVTNYERPPFPNPSINGTPIDIGTVIIPLEQPFNVWNNVFRVDHRLGAADNLTYRYHLDHRDQPNVTSNVGFGTRFAAAQKVFRQNHAISYTRPFSSRFLNEARVGYVRSLVDVQENDPRSSTVNVAGFFTIGGASAFPQGRVEQLYEYQDVATYISGRNSFKMGMDLRRNKLFGLFGTNSKGTWTFGSLADFLNSTPSTLAQAVNQATFDVSQWHHAYFFQDDLKATSDLTLNLGVRYEYSTISAGFFGATDPAIRDVGVPGPARPDKNNWAPRVGFAYSPSNPTGMFERLLGPGKTSIRGGFGMSYDVLFYNILVSTASNYPRVVTQTTSGPAIANLFPTLAPKTTTVPPLNPLGAFTNTPENVQSPTVNFWSLSVQRELDRNYIVELGYTGNRSYHQLRQSQANPGILTPAQAAAVIASGRANSVTVQRLNPAWGARNLLETSAKGEYHAGYIKFDKRMSRGLLLGANYTWSANFSDNDEAFTATDISPWTSQIPQDFFNLRNEWSRSAFDRPHRFAMHYVYDIPWFASSPAALRQAFGGWQVSGITEFQSGQVFTITTGLDTVGTLATGSFPGRPNYNPNGVFTKDPVTGDLRTFSTPLNGTGIVFAPMGPNGILANSMPSGGNLGRNTFRGPSFQNWNFTLMKKFPIRENLGFELRSDFVNMWNHSNFKPPEARMVSPTFGANTAPLLTDAREILLGAKLKF